MDWNNWIPQINAVLDFFLSLFPKIIDLMMISPVIGVPIILGMVGIAIMLVVRFVGAFGFGNRKEN